QVDELRVVGIAGDEAVELAEVVVDEKSRVTDEPGTIRLSLDADSMARLDIEEIHVFSSNQPNRPLVLPVRDGQVVTPTDADPLADDLLLADVDPLAGADFLTEDGAITEEA